MTPAALLSALAEAIKNDGGLVLLFVIIFITGVRRTWVFGREVDEMRRQLTDERVRQIQEVTDIRTERDQWRAAALWGMGHPSMQGKDRPRVSTSDADQSDQ